MFGWNKLSGRQRLLAVAGTAYFIASFGLGASSRTPMEWLRLSGPVVLVLGMVLNQASFTYESKTSGGWHALPPVCKVLLVTGLALCLGTLVLTPWTMVS